MTTSLPPFSFLSTLPYFFFFSLFFFTPLLHSSFAVGSLPLLAPITKDPTTLHYTSTVNLSIPPNPTTLLLHLGASFSWVDCTQNYNSTTYHYLPCHSPLCSSLSFFVCSNDSCSLFLENPISHRTAISPALIDTLSLPTTDGRNPRLASTLPSHLFSCSPTSLLHGLPKHVSGLLALGRSNFSFPAQISSHLSLPYKFSLCLSSSPSAPGVAFFGSNGPYFFPPSELDISLSLTYTPLLLNPVGRANLPYFNHPSDEYFIGVTAINVNGKHVPLNSSLLSIDDKGVGGTKLSTVVPYTTMQTSIYNSFLKVFIEEAAAMNLGAIKAISPFDVCFNSEDVGDTRTGPAVPTIDLVMQQGEGVFWRIFGANSMVSMEGGESLCLAFVDGGQKAGASVVIGGHQMEDNLVQFDLEGKRVGFSSSLLLMGTTCSNFNFTTTTQV